MRRKPGPYNLVRHRLTRARHHAADAEHTAAVLGRLLALYWGRYEEQRARVRELDAQLDEIYAKWAIRRPGSTARGGAKEEPGGI